MSVKRLVKIAPSALLILVGILGIGFLLFRLGIVREEAADLRWRLAQSDSTRRIAEGTVARMALEVGEITTERNDLRKALADSGRKIVFMARSIRVLTDSVDVLEGIVTVPDTIGDIGLGGDFSFGPDTVSLGVIEGEVFCAECLRFPPRVSLTFSPKPFVFDVGLAAHRNLPWEVFVTLRGLDERFRVVVDQPPEIVDWLREMREPPCRSRLLGFLPKLCDAQMEVGAGALLTQDVRFPVGGTAGASVGLGSRKFRLSTLAIVGEQSTLFAGFTLRF